MKVAAYIPARNATATLARAIESVRAQSEPPVQFFVVDDGSTDGTAQLCEKLGVEVLRNSVTLGRGASRALAMRHAEHELVLCCDAGNALAPDFVARGKDWFDDARVAAVYGKIVQAAARNVRERWRGRHLYRLDEPHEVTHGARLATFGALIRRSATLAVGNYDARRTEAEDHELSLRLASAGWDIVYDPALLVQSSREESMRALLERYARWYPYAEAATPTIVDYVRDSFYTLRVMAQKDLRAGDLPALAMTLALPHYRWARSLVGKNKLRLRTE